jgi:hypothetical protein
MKKTIAGLVMALSLLFALPVYGQVTAPSVVVDGKPVTFHIQPVKVDGSYFVEFKPVFTQLGLKVQWVQASKQIIGSNETTTIKLTVGNKNGSVNGVAKVLTAAPRIVKGYTLVPLRFIGEATNREVNWDKEKNLITITVKVDVAAEKAKVLEAYKKFSEFGEKEDVQGVMSLIDESSPYKGLSSVLEEQYKLYDIKGTIELAEVVDLRGNEAVIRTIETSEKLKGPFYLNKRVELMNLMKKSKDGQWRFSNLQLVAQEYIIPDGFFDKEAVVGEQDKKDILAVINANVDFTKKEDAAGALSTIDPSSPVYEASAPYLTELFKQYDLDYNITKTTIIEVSEKEAYVYMEQTTKKIAGPEFQDNKASYVNKLTKSADGKWKIYSTEIIKVDPLTVQK